MSSYPKLLDVTLTRFYEYEVFNPGRPLSLGVKQALASEIAIAINNGGQLAFLHEHYKDFRASGIQLLSDEDFENIPKTVFLDMLLHITTNEHRFEHLLNYVSQNGLGLMLQLLFYSHQNCCSYNALINAAHLAINHNHSELMPIFKHWVFKLNATQLNVEDLVHKVSVISISTPKEAEVAKLTTTSNPSEDSTESLKIVFSEQSASNAGSRDNSEDETDPIDYIDRTISFTPSYNKAQEMQLPLENTMPPLSESSNPEQASKLTI